MSVTPAMMMDASLEAQYVGEELPTSRQLAHVLPPSKTVITTQQFPEHSGFIVGRCTVQTHHSAGTPKQSRRHCEIQTLPFLFTYFWWGGEGGAPAEVLWPAHEIDTVPDQSLMSLWCVSAIHVLRPMVVHLSACIK